MQKVRYATGLKHPMNTTTQIIIQKAANGYIVSIPFQPRIVTQEDIVRQQARIYKDEFQGDPMLKGIQDPDIDNDDSDEFKVEGTPNVFVFKTLNELIGFLKTYL